MKRDRDDARESIIAPGKTAPAGGVGEGRVCAVIVSYCPDLIRLRALVESVVLQVDLVVIVDNGSGADAQAFLRKLADGAGLKLIEFGENRGIAAAHNAGIRHAMDNAFAYVLLLDHDSRLLPGCVSQLLQASRAIAESGVKVAAVGPQYDDDTTGRRAPFHRLYRWNLRKVYAQGMNETVEASVLISSGSLISCEVLRAIGLMDESLFIEGVDWEWCFRAAAHGYRLFGVASAHMQHSLGDGGIRVFGRILPLHHPLRHYYAYRNTVLMCKLAHVPSSWKFNFSLRLAARFFIYLFLAPRRRERCRLIGLGLYDGLLGRHGRLNLS